MCGEVMARLMATVKAFECIRSARMGIEKMILGAPFYIRLSDPGDFDGSRKGV